MGSLTPAGVVPPTDKTAAKKLNKAELKLRAKIGDACGGGQLMQLAACGTDPMNAGDCLSCTQWRHALEAIRSTYGS